MDIQVNKKIVWGLNGMTKEEITAYKPGETISSPATEIVIGGNVTKWFLIACPGGLNEDSKDSIELFLRLEKADSLDFNTKYILGIVGKYGNKETKKIRQSGESCEAATFGEHLLNRCEFFNPALGYLIDDKVTLYCKLTITARKITEKEKAASMSQNLLDVLLKMMIDAIFTDFKVVTSDLMVLRAHKSVLALRSHFFRGMLNSDMREAQSNIVKVPEDSVIMKEVLRYIYSNKVKNLSSLACELVFAAEKYQLDGLKELCLDSITKTLTTENTLQALLAADRLTKSEKLKAKCFEMIASNFQFISKSQEWEKLPPKLIIEIVQYTLGRDTIYV